MENAIRLEGFDPPPQSLRITPFDSETGDFLNEADDLSSQSDFSPEAPIEVDPVEVRANEEIEALQSLSAGIASMSNHLDALHAGMADQLANAIGEAVICSLPSVLEDGFAAEIAAATRQLVDRLEETRVLLKVSPLQHDTVVSAFGDLDPTLPVEIVDEPSLNPGQAHVDWATGGAQFDATDWTEAARAALKNYLEHISTRRSKDD